MLTRRQLLASTTAAAGLGLPARARAAGGARRVLILLVNGGWDPLFCFEPRLGDPGVDGPELDQDPLEPTDVESTRTFGEITLAVNPFKRPLVTAFFERWHAETAVVNGIWTGAIAHAPSLVRMLTGTASEANPDFGAIVGQVWGEDLPLGYIDLAGGAYPGWLAASSGRVGHRAQILNLLDDGSTFTAPSWTGTTYPTFTPTPADDSAVADWLRARTDRFRGAVGDGAGNRQLLDDRLEAQERAARIRNEAVGLLSTLELGSTPGALVSLGLAVDLLETGVCAATLCDTRMDWDTHADHAQQHGFFNGTFGALDATMRILSARGMLADTLVAVISEMARTPRLNAGRGKDHWPHTTAMLMGAGIAGGRVYGGYGPSLESLPVDYGTGEVDDHGELLRYDNFVGGLLSACGVDPEPWLPGVTPFPAFLRV